MKKLMKKSFIFCLIIFNNFLLGQNYNKFKCDNIESFIFLKSDTLQKEISTFNHKAIKTKFNIPNNKLKEIKLKYCTDSSAYFETGSWYSFNKIITIYYIDENKNNKKFQVRYLKWKYNEIILPDSVLNDIYDPIFCKKKQSRVFRDIKSCCKVYLSLDKRRIYIYMQNGYGNNKYEVTWVIKDDKYFTRVIDCLEL